MANSKCRWESPEQWADWSEWLAAGLHGRNRWRWPVLLTGVLFAQGRRTVTTWLRAAVAEILETFADRATIEQDFHDVKEVWGTGHLNQTISQKVQACCHVFLNRNDQTGNVFFSRP